MENYRITKTENRTYKNHISLNEAYDKAAKNYNTTITALNQVSRDLDQQDTDTWKEIRKNIKYTYKITSKEVNFQTCYSIVRTPILEGLIIPQGSETPEVIRYMGFKVVNNVFISTRVVGGNFCIFETGALLTEEECSILIKGGIPMRIINTKAVY